MPNWPNSLISFPVVVDMANSAVEMTGIDVELAAGNGEMKRNGWVDLEFNSHQSVRGWFYLLATVFGVTQASVLILTLYNSPHK